MKRYFLILIWFFSVFIPVSSYAQQTNKVIREVLPNGITLLMKNNPSSDIIALEVMIRAGTRWEKDDQAGITNFTGRMLLKGTEKRDAKAIAYDIESLGGIIDINVSPDYLEIYLLISKNSFAPGLEIFSDILFNSVFPEEEVEKERKSILDEITQGEDELFEVVYNLFKENMYGEHPYHKPEIGYKETIAKISRDELLQFYRTHFTPNNIVAAIVGNLEDKNIIELLKETLGKYPSGKKLFLTPFEFSPLKETKEVKIERECEGAWMILGFPATGIDINTKDYVTLKVIDSLLGSGMSSHLFVDLRERLGLAYQIGSFYPTRQDTSHFVTYIITAPYNVEKAKSGILWEIAKIKQRKIKEEELERAKKYLEGNFLIEHESNKNQAFYLAFYEIIGKGYSFDDIYPQYLRSVSAEDIRRVSQKYFKEYVLSVVSPAEEE